MFGIDRTRAEEVAPPVDNAGTCLQCQRQTQWGWCPNCTPIHYGGVAVNQVTIDGSATAKILAFMERHRPKRIRRGLGGGGYEQCQAGCKYEPGTSYEHIARAIANGLGLNDWPFWRDDSDRTPHQP